MGDLLRPALGLIFSPAHCLALDITILDQRLPADLSAHVGGNVHHLNVTNLAEHFITFLLLSNKENISMRTVTNISKLQVHAHLYQRS